MPLFLNTHVNKVDRKGRVSVPASFRAALSGQATLGQGSNVPGLNGQGFSGIVAFPSFRAPAIEVLDRERMEQLSSSADDLAQFSERRDDLAATIFAAAAELPFDGEGRIILPKNMADHAGITELAAFVGMGRTFQIWNPDGFERYRREAASRVREQGAALILRADKR
ncbi:MAG: division/cell wall cluster transcriptional repressor MraZ [Alphaproteobacteria bacterium]